MSKHEEEFATRFASAMTQLTDEGIELSLPIVVIEHIHKSENNLSVIKSQVRKCAKEDMPKTMTDEYVEFFDVDHIPEAVIPNLRWLIPMSMPAYRQPQDWPFLIREGFKGERS